MGRQFADLPSWEFSELEISNGVYQVTARRDGGIVGEAIDTDYDAALSGLREWATKVESDLTSAETTATVEATKAAEALGEAGYVVGLSGIASLHGRVLFRVGEPDHDVEQVLKTIGFVSPYEVIVEPGAKDVIYPSR